MTAIPRNSLQEFSVANPFYAGATVTVYTVDENLEATATKADLYEAPNGAGTLTNPQVLDSEGKWEQPVYVDRPVVLEIATGETTTETGISALMPRWRGVWALSTTYYPGEFVRHPTDPKWYVALVGHVSSSFAADLAAEKLEEVFDMSVYPGGTALVTVGTIAAGTWEGDVIDIAHGGTGAATAAAARDALGLEIGADVQAYDADLTALAGLSTTGFVRRTGSATFTAEAIDTADINATGTPDNTTYLRGDGTWAIPPGGGGSGTVTSVAVSGGTTGLTTSGGPVTGSGTITLGGTLGVANGGTGETATPTNGQLLIGDGSGFTLGTLTAGSGISITNGSGTVTVAASGGTSPIKATVNFNGTGTPAITKAFNVSSITDDGTGIYTLNFTDALADANYTCAGMARGSGAASQMLVSYRSGGSKTTTAVQVNCMLANVGNVDSTEINVIVCE